jgi:hypothetical protein
VLCVQYIVGRHALPVYSRWPTAQSLPRQKPKGHLFHRSSGALLFLAAALPHGIDLADSTVPALNLLEMKSRYVNACGFLVRIPPSYSVLLSD